MKDEKPYHEEWESEAPILAGLPNRKNSEQVPEGYFEELTDRIMAKIKVDLADNQVSGSHSAGNEVKTGWSMRTKIWAIAAAVTLLVAGGYVLRSALKFSVGHGAESVEFYEQLAQVDDQAIIQALKHAELTDEELFAALGQNVSFQDEMDTESSSMMDYLEDEDLGEIDLSNLEFDTEELM